jgi:UDP-4-amino-4,6-dideoxy-N-acetyl-beta-L-altrosamine transaminase
LSDNAHIPYSRQSISESDIEAVNAVLRSDFLTQGPAVPEFENAFAECHAVDHAIAVCNATAALHIACLALGVGPGDLVWTVPNSFVASANCARYCGADVDFVDIDPDSRNLSVAALETKLVQATRLPKVVIPVDFAGLPCDLNEIRALADRYGFKIIEDASHAVGASYHGKPVGCQYADISVFSFHPVKIITTAEGGVCTTKDDMLAEKLRLLRSHGITREPSLMESPSEGEWYYEQICLGFNYRMTEMQAALGRSQLSRLAPMQAARAALAARYDMLLADLPIILPQVPSDRVSAHHLYVVEIDSARTTAKRAEIFGAMRAANIGVNVHYIPIHLQPDYRRLGFKAGDFPDSEAYYEGAITLPLFPEMTHAQQDVVIAALKEELN